MEHAIKTGSVILLNGASSSGKTSLALAVQMRIEMPFWHISIDHLRDSGVLPLARTRSGDFSWAEMREGFFRGFEASLESYVRHGNNLIVEHIIEDRASLIRLGTLMNDVDLFFVGLHCDLSELERRERERGDRRIGDARRDFQTVHRHCTVSVVGKPPCGGRWR